jgi:nondiscriminating aspartyl-tRNA synthetase
MSLVIDKHYWYEITRNFKPVSTGSSLHVYHEVYHIKNDKVTFYWANGSDESNFTLEIEPWKDELKRVLSTDLPNRIGQKVLLKGWVSQFRELKKMSFLILRDRSGYCQVFIPKNLNVSLLSETVVEIIGTVKEETQCRYGGVEVVAESINIISKAEVLPFPISREEGIPPFNTLNLFRPLTLRKEKERCIFKIQSEITTSFRDYLRNNGFTEINSTKLSAAGLEGGADMFNVDYFDEKMFLTQSPQFYKQMMVGVYERVFEVGKVYRAEGSNTNKHLSEFIGLDFEIGFINSVNEVIQMEEDVLKHIFKTLNNTCKYEIDYLGIKLNWVTIPRLTYSEAVQILEKEMDFKLQEVGLTTQAEKLISEYIKSKSNSDFVFITKYPLSERPFYAMPSENGIDSETFELLYKGTEITSGGQRIHNYEELVRSITLKGLNPDNFQSYLMPFKYGMPPHGGMGLGLERLMKQMLDLQVVDEASLIPRTKDKFIH